jgi:rRNA maturation RNase YbeY
VHHSTTSRALLSDRRLQRVARRALQVAQQRGHFALSLAFVADRAIRRLNRAYAGNDYTTDVLSFSARENTKLFRAPPFTQTFLGDIVISLPQAMRQAKAAGHALAREVDLLLTHGVLHLLGYDHATAREAKQMRLLEEQALQNF